MALRGQRFELDLDQPDFTANLVQEESNLKQTQPDIVKDLIEHNPQAAPTPPKFKPTRTGFPEHKKNNNISAFRQRQNTRNLSANGESAQGIPDASHRVPTQVPSDRAIVDQLSKKYGYDINAQKDEISEENKKRIAEMSVDDIEEARAELMANLNPVFIERLLRKANIDDGPQIQPGDRKAQNQDLNNGRNSEVTGPDSEPAFVPEHTNDDVTSTTSPPPAVAQAIHFPVPPRSASSFVPLNPDDSNFLEDLRTHYFPEIPHDPSSLAWLQDPSIEENEDSAYHPGKDSFPTSSLRFSFIGKLIPPKESLEIDVSKGLHHHGLAPSSAGYTIPELAILARSTLPNQRCIAFQVLGRILFRLGRGDFGPRGSELQEGLWFVVENERVVEIIMREANRDGGHMSAKAYATEALWLWRKGGGGDRGLLKEGEKVAK